MGWYGTTGKIIVHGENLIETLLYCIDYEQLLNVEKVKGKSHRIALQDKSVWEESFPIPPLLVHIRVVTHQV